MDDITRFEIIGDLYYSRFLRLRPGKAESMASGRDSGDAENRRQFDQYVRSNLFIEDAITRIGKLDKLCSEEEERCDELKEEVERLRAEVTRLRSFCRGWSEHAMLLVEGDAHGEIYRQLMAEVERLKLLLSEAFDYDPGPRCKNACESTCKFCEAYYAWKSKVKSITRSKEGE